MIPIRPRYFFPRRLWRHALLACNDSELQIDLRDFEYPIKLFLARSVSLFLAARVSRYSTTSTRSPLTKPSDGRSNDAVRARMRPTVSLATGPVNYRRC
jgi:hypothetical protein